MRALRGRISPLCDVVIDALVLNATFSGDGAKSVVLFVAAFLRRRTKAVIFVKGQELLRSLRKAVCGHRKSLCQRHDERFEIVGDSFLRTRLPQSAAKELLSVVLNYFETRKKQLGESAKEISQSFCDNCIQIFDFGASRIESGFLLRLPRIMIEKARFNINAELLRHFNVYHEVNFVCVFYSGAKGENRSACKIHHLEP